MTVSTGIVTNTEQLRENQEQFALAVLAANDGLWSWDLLDGSVYFSPRWKAMLGYAEHELPNGRGEWQSRIHPEDRERAVATLQAHLAGETPFYELEHRLRHKDGAYRWILARGATLRDDTGKPYRIAGSHTDVTARKEAENALRRGEALYRALVETSPDSIVVTKLDGSIAMANQRAAELYRYEQPLDMVGMQVAELVCSEDRPRVMPGLGEIIAGGHVAHREYMLCRRDGTLFPAEIRASVIVDGQGQPQAVMTIARDVSERQRAEEQLRETEAQYRGIFEATSDAVIISDLDGRVVEANPAACSMHGYSREEFVGLLPTARLHPDDLHLFGEYMESIKSDREFHARSRNVRRDGSIFPAEVHGTAFLYKGKLHGLAAIRDVTDEVKAHLRLERAVEERTHELSTLLDVSREVASTLELEPLLGLILDHLKTMVDYSSTSIASGSDGRLEILGYRGPIPPGGRDRLRAALESFRHAHSWMGVPLMVGQQVIGMLSLVHHEPNFYRPQHARLVLALGQQAAVAIQNARLYKQAQEYAALDERARLARELHDSVTQALFSMTMHARATGLMLEREGIPRDGRIGRSVDQLSDLTQGALAEMRALIFELRPDSLQEEGLAAALRKHAAAVSAREGLRVDVEAPEGRIPLGPGQDLHLYRLAQEALHNVVKHAHAGEARFCLAVEGGNVVLEIADNGVGFDLSAVTPGHLGLRTMADRAGDMGGTLRIQSAPGAGVSARVTVPLMDRGADD